MPIPITGLYAGLTVILAIILGFRIGLYRGRKNIPMHDGGDPQALLRMRQHGNLVETAALTLLTMAIIEANGASATTLHILGITYLAARVLHPFGLKTDNVMHPLRAAGAGLSTFVMLAAGGIAIWQFVQSM